MKDINNKAALSTYQGPYTQPIFVPRLDKPILHFSGGNGGNYARKGDENRDDNKFRL
jgi:hypothetical protein